MRNKSLFLTITLLVTSSLLLTPQTTYSANRAADQVQMQSSQARSIMKQKLEVDKTKSSSQVGSEVITGLARLDKVDAGPTGWSQALLGYGSLSPAVGDVDGDGYAEIVVGVGSIAGVGLAGGVEVFSHDGQREVGWPKDTDKSMISSPALGDLDRDGIDDIIICSSQGVHAYLSSSRNWFRSAYTGGNGLWGYLATPIIADLENDRILEVLMMNMTGTVYAWRNNGEPVVAGKNGVFAQATLVDPFAGFPCLAVVDLDKDGQNEVIAGAANGTNGGLYIWDIEGDLLLGPGDYSDKFTSIFGIAIANIDRNEDLEIIVLGANQNYLTLSAFKQDGTQAVGYPIILEDREAGNWWGNHPAVGDLDGDGSLEIAVSVWSVIIGGYVYAWHQDGTPLISGSPLFASGLESFGDPVLADVNADGNVDIIVRAGFYFGTGYERVFAWDYEGNLVPGWPIYAPTGQSNFRNLPYAPVITDIDKDGKLNMILATDYPNYKLISWGFDIDYDSTTLPWPKYRHDKWNSGRYGFTIESQAYNLPPFGVHVRNWTRSSVTLAWKPKFPRLSKGYNIYRSTASGNYTQPPINSTLIPQEDSLYEDMEADGYQTNYYVMTNVDLNDEESDFSEEISFSLFDKRILLIDLTSGSKNHPLNLVDGDSVDAFYQRALDGYGYTYVSPLDSSNGFYSTLAFVGNFPLLVVHSEDLAIQCADVNPISSVLKEYFEAGGSVIIEGRRNLTDDNYSFGMRTFSPGSFVFDCLGIDSAFVPPWDRYHRTEEFIGAHSLDEDYPEVVLDTARVNSSGYTVTGLDGRLPGVGYFFPSSLPDILYSFGSFNGGSSADGQAVAIKRLGQENGIIYFDFPLWFVREDIATEILHKAIKDLELYTDVPDEKKADHVPTGFVLEQNYPNPFNSETVVQYTLPQDCQVKVDIYNILGRKVKTLIDEQQTRGFKRTTWDGKDKNGNSVASGMYFCRIRAGSFAQAKKMLLLK